MDINNLININSKKEIVIMDSNSFWYQTNKVSKQIMESDLVGLYKEVLTDKSFSPSTVQSNMHVYEKWRDFLHAKIMPNNCSVQSLNSNFSCLHCPHRSMHVNYLLKIHDIRPEEFFEKRYTNSMNELYKISNEQMKTWFKEFINNYRNKPKPNGEFRSPNTINTYIKQIKRWQTVMNKEGNHEFDFADSIKVKEVLNILDPISPSELQILSTEILNNSAFYSSTALGSKRLKAIYFLMLQTGLRLNEVCTLNQKDLKILSSDSTGELKILGKGGKERIVGVSQETIILIKDYLLERTSRIIDNEPALFLNNHFQPLQRWSIIEMFKRISKKTGIKINAHKIRRTSATLRVQDGADNQDLKNNFGWSSDQVANRYMKSAKNLESINSQKKFNPFITNQTILENQLNNEN